jgi:DNA-binding NtrC family response regulator
MSFKKLDRLLLDTAVPQETPSPGSAAPVVLIIDDDPAIRRALEALLQRSYRLRISDSANAGISLFDADVAAVVLDVKMKGRDGFWACEQIRRMDPLVPVIFFSAFQDVKNAHDIINDYRPFAYIMKDGDSARLLSALANATSLHKMVQVNRRLSARFKKTPVID